MNIEELARQAGVWATFGAILPPSKTHNERLASFAALVLEEAAKTCEDSDVFQYDDPGGFFAELIRALKPVAS